MQQNFSIINSRTKDTSVLGLFDGDVLVTKHPWNTAFQVGLGVECSHKQTFRILGELGEKRFLKEHIIIDSHQRPHKFQPQSMTSSKSLEEDNLDFLDPVCKKHPRATSSFAPTMCAGASGGSLWPKPSDLKQLPSHNFGPKRL